MPMYWAIIMIQENGIKLHINYLTKITNTKKK